MRSMSDYGPEIPVHERLAAGEVQEPNAVAIQDVGTELCLIEGHGMARRRGQPVAGKATEIAAPSSAAKGALVYRRWSFLLLSP